MMRIKYVKLITFILILANIFIFYYSWRYFSNNNFGITEYYTRSKINKLKENELTNSGTLTYSEQIKQQNNRRNGRIQNTNKHIKKTLTIIFRDFYHYDNDLKQSIASIIKLIPSIKIYVITDEVPYPPLDIFNTDNILSYNETLNMMSLKNQVKLFTLNYDVNKNLNNFVQYLKIKTKYILFMPDSVRLNGRTAVTKILNEIENYLSNKGVKSRQTNVNTFVIPFVSSYQKIINNCCKVNLNLTNWLIEYIVQNITQHCDMVSLADYFITIQSILLTLIYISVFTVLEEECYSSRNLINERNT